MTTTKILLNSTISTKDTKFITLDVKDFYYGTDLDNFEYLLMAIEDIPQEIVEQYSLLSIANNG